MVSDRILQLLAKQMGQDISEEERAELEALLANQPEYHYFIEVLKSIEGEKRHQEPAIEEKELIKEGWRQLHEELNRKQTTLAGGREEKREKTGKRRIGTWILRAAIWAGIIMVGIGSFLIWRSAKDKTREQGQLLVKTSQISIPSGAPQKKILPDGSIVWLNAGSQLRYGKHFGVDKREIYLVGEAYFDIKHDPRRPFIVHAGNINIRVLGTAFNVEAYANEDQVETTLINGKIKVEIAGYPDKSFILRPNEKLSVSTKGFDFKKVPFKPIGGEASREVKFKVQELKPDKSISTLPEIAWTEDKFVFQNERFDAVTKSLERRFGVKIIFETKSLKQERLSGVFKNESIQKALEILQMTTPFVYEQHGDTVYLRREGQLGGDVMRR